MLFSWLNKSSIKRETHAYNRTLFFFQNCLKNQRLQNWKIIIKTFDEIKYNTIYFYIEEKIYIWSLQRLNFWSKNIHLFKVLSKLKNNDKWRNNKNVPILRIMASSRWKDIFIFILIFDHFFSAGSLSEFQ